ncbi:LysM domain-containing protein [Desulfuromonas sp. AOP6]|uniref:LysM peptidoglycan-binding domain-containing protein n=1 Tax=Desulfuromonas sp. AOP6 TaxID=1566351 RepID=UPI00128082CB|nr:LysM domain-containing protein [Desulfuromonas sp. AOP6]BCA78698.1 peptidoglycan-binding protein LysM [Desulfuromonas sp. AOP6]
MTIKKLLLLTCLLLMPLCAFAQGTTQTYVIKKGDTLWGISERFLKDSDYWPNLWSHNPFIGNPHLIYPGQKIAIRDGRIEIIPEFVTIAPTEPESLEKAIEEAGIEPQEVITISTQGGSPGFISTAGIEALGTLVDTIDNRLLMATGETVFLEMKNLGDTRIGDRFAVVALAKEVKHPVTGQKVGHRIARLGTVQIIQIHQDVATAVITSSASEIQRGALLLPVDEQPTEVVLQKAEVPVSGYIIDGADGKITLSQYDVVYLDQGSNSGLQVGNLLNITREREASDLAIQNRNLVLPQVLLGAAVVIETRPESAAALVLKSVAPMYRGDRVTALTE